APSGPARNGWNARSTTCSASSSSATRTCAESSPGTATAAIRCEKITPSAASGSAKTTRSSRAKGREATRMNNLKRLQKIIDSPQNVRFGEMVTLVNAFGFRLLRTSGGHHIFGRQGIAEQLNLQNVNGKAKPY